MKKKRAFNNLESLEIHHPVIAFLILLIGTILITRVIVYYVIYPDLSLMGLELHHFDYGLALLIVTCLLLLFGEKHFRLYLLSTGVGLGLIIDELWFVRKQIGGNNPAIYNPSLPYVLITAIGICFVAFLISKRKK